MNYRPYLSSRAGEGIQMTGVSGKEQKTSSKTVKGLPAEDAKMDL